MPVVLPRWIYSTPEQRGRFFERVLEREPGSGAGSTAVTSVVPPDGIGGDVVIVDRKAAPTPEMSIPDVLQVSISPDYFKVIGIPLEVGRGFDDRDNERSPAVTVVNEALVRKFFSQENPIGARIKMGRPGSPWLTIVGVVGNEKHQDFFHPMTWEEPSIVFRPVTQEPPPRASLIFRRLTDSNAAATTLQKQIEAVDNNVAIGNVEALDARLSRTLSYPRFRAIILAAFAGLALLLAVIGLYAVLSQLIAQRTAEFGLRMALGAQRSDVLKLVLGEAMLLTLMGLAGGLIITFSLAGLLRSLLFGLKTTDPLTLTLGSLLLVTAALLATYLPARRAMRIDPQVALRHE
jgi:putative ABC transport system permease protein